MRFGPLAKFAVAFLVALLLGVGTAWWSLSGILLDARERSGAWSINTAVGSSEADPYLRASVAIGGLLALNKSEAIYFMAVTDDDGRPLTGDCTYEVSGHGLPGRWWSITAYADDHYLIPNDENRYSFNVSSLGLRDAPADAGYTFTVAATETGTHWLPVAAGEHFSLTLRVYGPPDEVVADPLSLDLLKVTRTGCVTQADEEAAS